MPQRIRLTCPFRAAACKIGLLSQCRLARRLGTGSVELRSTHRPHHPPPTRATKSQSAGRASPSFHCSHRSLPSPPPPTSSSPTIEREGVLLLLVSFHYPTCRAHVTLVLVPQPVALTSHPPRLHPSLAPDVISRSGMPSRPSPSKPYPSFNEGLHYTLPPRDHPPRRQLDAATIALLRLPPTYPA